MKINAFPAILAAAISALLAYGLYSFCKTPGQELLLAIGGFVCFFLTLSVGVAVRFEEGRTSTNTAVLGWFFFFIMLISHVVFTFILFATPVYIIINGVLLLASLGVIYAVAKAKQ